MSFFDKLDAILGIETPKPKEEPIVEHHTPMPEASPEDDFESPPVQDPDFIPDYKAPDPFKNEIDSILLAEGVDVEKEMRRRYNPAGGDLTEHDWAMARERLFSEEPYVFKCKRCLKHVEVGPDQVIREAVIENGIDPNCGIQVVNDTMSM